MGKEGYNGYSGEDCVEWFVYEILKTDTHLKNYFKKEIETTPDTTPETFNTKKCCLSEKDFKE